MSDFSETIDLTVEPWKTLAPLCWNEPSPFRLGGQAEKHGVSGNPYTKPKTQALFDEGRESYRRFLVCNARPLRFNFVVDAESPDMPGQPADNMAR